MVEGVGLKKTVTSVSPSSLQIIPLSLHLLSLCHRSSLSVSKPDILGKTMHAYSRVPVTGLLTGPPVLSSPLSFSFSLANF